MNELTATEKALAEKAHDITAEYVENVLKLCDGQKASFAYALMKTCAESVDDVAEKIKDSMKPSLISIIRSIMSEL